MFQNFKYPCFFILVMFCSLWASCQSRSPKNNNQSFANLPIKQIGKLDTATFAGGCFWCIEAQFKELKGVKEVISGYTGGDVKNPTYAQVCLGNTGHAEAVNVIYDPQILSFDQLLEAFFYSHDPTQLNRQGNDIGTQYRSAIFVHNQEQLAKVNFYIKKMEEKMLFDKPIVTTIEAFSIFYIAEDYHQNYYSNNKEDRYCQFVIKPKLEKFKQIFTSEPKR